jgi:hypothetical protein
LRPLVFLGKSLPRSVICPEDCRALGEFAF